MISEILNQTEEDFPLDAAKLFKYSSYWRNRMKVYGYQPGEGKREL